MAGAGRQERLLGSQAREVQKNWPRFRGMLPAGPHEKVAASCQVPHKRPGHLITKITEHRPFH
jgi:hypothetical protein